MAPSTINSNDKCDFKRKTTVYLLSFQNRLGKEVEDLITIPGGTIKQKPLKGSKTSNSPNSKLKGRAYQNSVCPNLDRHLSRILGSQNI